VGIYSKIFYKPVAFEYITLHRRMKVTLWNKDMHVFSSPETGEVRRGIPHFYLP
jgi:hypothetical protein